MGPIVARFLSAIGWIVLIAGAVVVIAAFQVPVQDRAMSIMVALPLIIGTGATGCLFIGFGKVIELLDDMKRALDLIRDDLRDRR